VRKKRWQRKNRHVASLQGELQRTGEFSAKMFNYEHCCLIFSGSPDPSRRSFPEAAWTSFELVCRLSCYSEGDSAVAHFFLAFSAQKTHVKPQNDLTFCHSITSAWHFSFGQMAILDIDSKRDSPGQPPGANLLI
jgi:hypothetical protein